MVRTGDPDAILLADIEAPASVWVPGPSATIGEID